MRERDLERATEIFGYIKSLEGDFSTHDVFGKYLCIQFALPKDDGPVDYVDAFTALALNQDELHARTNLIIRAMLEEKMTGYKAELRKLGIKLECDMPPENEKKEKKEKKQPLRLVGPKIGGKE